MIRLTRRPLDAALAYSCNNFEGRYLALLRTGAPIPGSLLARYRDPSLKRHLTQETAEKCAYCESKVTSTYPGDVEHILCKLHNPDLRLSPDNLTLSCWKCNHEKDTYNDPALPLLNPFLDDIDNCIIAFGALMMARPGPYYDRAYVTIVRIGLNRSELIERRKEAIIRIAPLAQAFVTATPGPYKKCLQDELCRQSNETAEFSCTLHAYITQTCGHFR